MPGVSTPTLTTISHHVTQHTFKSLTIPRHTLVLRWLFPSSTPHTEVDVFQLLASIDAQIDAVFSPFFTQQRVRPADKLGLCIDFNTTGADDFYVNAYMRDSPVKQLFERLARVLQSSKHLLFSTWTVTVDIFRNQPGGTVKRKRTPAHISSFLDLGGDELEQGKPKCPRVCSEEESLMESKGEDEQNESSYEEKFQASSDAMCDESDGGITSPITCSSPPDLSAIHPPPDLASIRPPPSMFGDPSPPDLSTIRPPPSSQMVSRKDPCNNPKKKRRRGKGLRPWCYKVLHNKKSVIIIKNPDDNLCMHRAIVVSLAYQEWQEAKADEHVSKADVQRANDRYRYAANAQRNRQKVLACALQEQTKTSSPGGYDDLVKISKHVGRNITMLNLSNEYRQTSSCIEFNTRSVHNFEAESTLFIVRDTEQLDGEHFHAVTSVKAFFGCSYYCKKCNVRSDGKYQHRCIGDTSCTQCRRPEEEHVKPLDEPSTCETCFRTFTDADCMQLHEKVICKRTWFCNDCRRTYTHARKPEDHKHHERQCAVCKEWVGVHHRCFIQPKAAKPCIEEDKIRTFDFESDMSQDGIHIPNFAAVCHGATLEHVTEYTNAGDSIMAEFMDKEILNPENRGTTYVAHNAKGYDSHFIKEELHRRGVKFDPITNGRKLMQLVIPALRIRIIDSHNFIPAPLSKLPKIFGLNGAAKGTYPYRFNTKANWSYTGDIPPFEFFLPEGMSTADLRLDDPVATSSLDDDESKLLYDLQQRHNWWKTLKDQNYVYNNFDELRKYCNNDAWLLYVAIMKFRTDFMKQTATCQWSGDGEAVGVDPLTCVTIASAVMTAYRHKFLERDTIAYSPHCVDIHSLVSIQWLEFMSFKSNRQIQHARNGGEVKVCGFKVDGFCAATKTVYEFNGCYWHGCPTCFPNQALRCQKQLHKEAQLQAKGYNVVSMWECTFKKLEASDPLYHEFIRSHPQLQEKLPLNVREAFFGGRTNASRLYYKFEDGEVGRYVDFTSLYPSVNKQGLYPVGHPQIILNPSLTKMQMGQYFGVAKCKIVPPRNLYHPVLPARIRDRLMFTLCRACAEDPDKPAKCAHADNERALLGTWCTPEIVRAQKEGYTISNVYEVHHFEESKTGLLEDFVNTFLKAKQEASGWPQPDMTQIEKDAYVKRYADHEGIELEPAAIKKNPGLRQVAKLMLTSLWGKFGQRGNLPKVRICTTLKQFNELMFNPRYKILAAQECPLNTRVYQIGYCEASAYLVQEPPCSNAYVASFTTCWARLRLYDVLCKLGQDVLYYDTDSVIYISRSATRHLEPPLGDFLGDLTDELPHGRHIVEFVSTGPKSYAYRDNTDATVIKFKGIAKSLYNVRRVNFKSMLKCVDNARYCITGDDSPKNMLFKIDTWGKIQTQYQLKVFRMVYEKRLICAGYMTYPFGFDMSSVVS